MAKNIQDFISGSTGSDSQEFEKSGDYLNITITVNGIDIPLRWNCVIPKDSKGCTENQKLLYDALRARLDSGDESLFEIKAPISARLYRKKPATSELTSADLNDML